MRPVIPALAALAWGEPRRRAYWEQELLNALVIIDRGWSTPEEMSGSWAGAMGHTQWMPEVWLHMGVDYDGDGRISPFGKPDDALAGTAQYLLKRGNYRRGEHWGYEVRGATGGEGASRTYAAWQKAGVTRADGQPFPHPNASAKLWVPAHGGPAFLLGPNFHAVRSYNPSMTYTLSIVHLGDRIMGGEPFVQKFPGGERAYPRSPRCRKSRSASDRSGLRHRRHRRPRRQRHHAGGAEFPAQDRHAAGGRLCRRDAAGTVARGALIRFYGPPPQPIEPIKDHPVTTATAKAAPAAHGTPANAAHPSLRELDRPVKLTAANAPGWGSDVVAETLRALEIPYIALNPGASYRGLHDLIVNYLGNETPQMLLCLHEEIAVAIAQGYAKVTGKAMAAAVHSNVGPVPRHHGDLQCLVRPHAGADPGRDRSGGCGQAAALDRLDPYRARPRRHRARLHQMGRPAGLAGGGARGDHPRALDRQYGPDGPGLYQSRCRDAGIQACRAAWTDRRHPLHAATDPTAPAR